MAFTIVACDTLSRRGISQPDAVQAWSEVVKLRRIYDDVQVFDHEGNPLRLESLELMARNQAEIRQAKV